MLSFKESLEKLNITDYGERIFKSNSHGELLHLLDYQIIALSLTDEGCHHFRDWFIEVVGMAEKHWKRPESVFQYILKTFREGIR